MIFRDNLNAFVQDTGLLIGAGYLLARHRTLNSLFLRKIPLDEGIRLGLIFGFMGMTEVVLPHEQSPYATDTLITALATVVGGTIPGVVCALTTAIVSFFLQATPDAAERFVTLLLAVLLARPFRRLDASGFDMGWGMVAGLLATISELAVDHIYTVFYGQSPERWHSYLTIFANGFGMAVMISMFNEAWIRSNAERHRLDAERSRALASQAQLGALRARLHPHFLYNTLASIAGLCAISPERAQDAIVGLGDLMRRTLEASASSKIALKAEMENVETYLGIEQTRLGDRLRVCWDVDPDALTAQVPPLSVQTLVENAVNHGVAKAPGGGTVRIRARRVDDQVLVAVADDGPGIPAAARRALDQPDDAPIHGMAILSRQLALQFGKRSRLRVFGGPGHGTMAAFAAPACDTPPRRRPAWT